mgnify:CR=1 FL=1
MNKYSLDFDKKASKDLLSLDKSVRNFILDELLKNIPDIKKEDIKTLNELNTNYKKLYKNSQGHAKYINKMSAYKLILKNRKIYFSVIYVQNRRKLKNC